MAFSAVLLGADLVEKHIALSNNQKSHDSKFSLKGDEIKKFRNEINLAWKLRGRDFFYRDKSEIKSKIYRRSIYACKTIKLGERFNTNNIKVVRPGFGVHPKYFSKLLNKKSKANYEVGSRIKIEEIK